MSVVRKLLAKINERKATCLDNIPSRLLKMAGNIIAPSLTQIFIKSINTGIFPTEWKLARVTPIFKKDKRDDPNNYRPISVIPTVAKIFEKIIYDQLCDYLYDICLINQARGPYWEKSARGLDRTDRAQRGAYKKDQGPIFSQDGPEQAWLIRDLLYD